MLGTFFAWCSCKTSLQSPPGSPSAQPFLEKPILSAGGGCSSPQGTAGVCVQVMVLVMVSSRMSYPTSQPGRACETQQLLGSDEEKLPVELGAPCPQAAAENWSQTWILMVLASLLTFGNQILLLRSFLVAEWKIGRSFGGAFLVMVCKIYGLVLKGPLA